MGFLHLLLRTNADVTVIGPVKAWVRSQWKFFSSSDVDMGAQMKMPVAMEGSLNTPRLTQGASEKYRELLSPVTLTQRLDTRSPRTAHSDSPLPVPPKPMLSGGLTRNESINYSAFPANNPQPQRSPINPSLEADADVLLPPQPLFSRRHQRDSSNISSATVRIGLRLSHGILPNGTEYVDAPCPDLPIQSPNSPDSLTGYRPSPLSQIALRESAESMELPIQFRPPTPSPQPSPTQEHTINPHAPASPWPSRSTSLKNRRNGAQIEQAPWGDYRMKQLPPIPGRPTSDAFTVSDGGSIITSLPRRSISNPHSGSRRSPGNPYPLFL